MKNILITFLVLVLVACSESKPKVELSELNLLQHGFPITIQAPIGSKVNVGELGFSKDVTIASPDSSAKYSIQILIGDAQVFDVKKIKDDVLELEKSSSLFSKVILEEDAGFIYETMLDSTHINYDFRYVKVKADKEYLFQTSMMGSFSLEDVEIMYEAVK